MTKDYEHLTWILDRLIHQHKENPNADYILRLRKIISDMRFNEKASSLPSVSSNGVLHIPSNSKLVITEERCGDIVKRTITVELQNA